MISVVKHLNTVDSEILAAYILKKHGSMSHLKLQKLVFYVQAYHLAYFNADLISDEFEAWVHGPVSRKLYESLNTENALYSDVFYEEKNDSPDTIFNESLTNDQLQLIDDVLEELSPLTTLQLENMVHSEMPWKTAREGYSTVDKCHVIIEKEIIRTFYKTLIYGKETTQKVPVMLSLIHI